ncbi:MAG: hypothetical protein ACJ8M1_00925 [Chthoniobacterales bacterium]
MRSYPGSLLILCAVVGSTLVQPASAADPPPVRQRQFIYVLHLVPRLYDDKNWTTDDAAALQRHFVRFQHAIRNGRVGAGRANDGIRRKGVRDCNLPSS